MLHKRWIASLLTVGFLLGVTFPAFALLEEQAFNLVSQQLRRYMIASVINADDNALKEIKTCNENRFKEVMAQWQAHLKQAQLHLALIDPAGEARTPLTRQWRHTLNASVRYFRNAELAYYKKCLKMSNTVPRSALDESLIGLLANNHSAITEPKSMTQDEYNQFAKDFPLPSYDTGFDSSNAELDIIPSKPLEDYQIPFKMQLSGVPFGFYENSASDFIVAEPLYPNMEGPIRITSASILNKVQEANALSHYYQMPTLVGKDVSFSEASIYFIPNSDQHIVFFRPETSTAAAPKKDSNTKTCPRSVAEYSGKWEGGEKNKEYFVRVENSNIEVIEKSDDGSTIYWAGNLSPKQKTATLQFVPKEPWLNQDRVPLPVQRQLIQSHYKYVPGEVSLTCDFMGNAIVKLDLHYDYFHWDNSYNITKMDRSSKNVEFKLSRKF